MGEMCSYFKAIRYSSLLLDGGSQKRQLCRFVIIRLRGLFYVQSGSSKFVKKQLLDKK